VYKIENLSRVYVMGRVNVKALDGVSFTVPNGDMLAIMGRSGSGKSTLLKQIGMLDRPTSGSVTFQDDEVTRLPENQRARLRLQYLGYVFQEYALLGELTAHQNVYLPGMMLGQKDTDFKRRATELLEIVGLGARTNHYPKELSGGEQQRVAIARALINNPRIVLADEPCANLDTVSGKLVMETLSRLNRELKVTIVFVSHDPADADYARHKIVLSDGKICEDVTLK
jgi:putative ABC transport system ATP-binding protein